MSYTEMHRGSLKQILENFTHQELKEFLKNNKNFKTEDLKRELDFYEIYHESTKKLSFVFHKNKMYEVVYHEEYEETDYLLDVKKLDNGLINFNLIFYNGGTCFSEMLKEGLNDL